MANTTNTNVSLSTLQYYDSKLKVWVKAEDSTNLEAAKTYTDTLANGAVADNTAAIAAINNADTGIAATAKNYADGLNTAMSERVQALEDVPYATESDIDSLFATT